MQGAVQYRVVGNKALFFVLVNVQVDLGREGWRGSWDIDPSAKSSCSHLQAWQLHRSHCCWSPYMQPFARYLLVGLENDLPGQTPGHTATTERKRSLWREEFGLVPTASCFGKTSLAIAIPSALPFLLMLGVGWWCPWISCLALEFCIFGCIAKALKILLLCLSL